QPGVADRPLQSRLLHPPRAPDHFGYRLQVLHLLHDARLAQVRGARELRRIDGHRVRAGPVRRVSAVPRHQHRGGVPLHAADARLARLQHPGAGGGGTRRHPLLPAGARLARDRQGTTTKYYDYSAMAADFFVNLALPGDQEFATGVGIYRWDYGPNRPRTGNGIGGEIGYRIGPINPQVNILWFNSDPKSNSSFRAAGGVNYYFVKHNAKLQLEFSS